MFAFEVEPARQRLESGIHFRRMGGGYWYPDLIVDRNAINLIKVKFHPRKTEEEIRQLFSSNEFNIPVTCVFEQKSLTNAK